MTLSRCTSAWTMPVVCKAERAEVTSSLSRSTWALVKEGTCTGRYRGMRLSGPDWKKTSASVANGGGRARRMNSRCAMYFSASLNCFTTRSG